jgi:hypothetical protein
MTTQSPLQKVNFATHERKISLKSVAASQVGHATAEAAGAESQVQSPGISCSISIGFPC